VIAGSWQEKTRNRNRVASYGAGVEGGMGDGGALKKVVTAEPAEKDIWAGDDGMDITSNLVKALINM
jgi:hypothetical protein